MSRALASARTESVAAQEGMRLFVEEVERLIN